jgi:subtilisin family serine protease
LAATLALALPALVSAQEDDGYAGRLQAGKAETYALPKGAAWRAGRLVPAHKLEPHVEHPHLRQLRDLPNDPLFTNQWHLRNTGQSGTAGVDVNVSPWWDFAGNTRLGAGVVIGIIDGGLETTHPDFAGNYLPALSYDFLSNDPDPTPQGGSGHGTAVAGTAAARGGNGIGVSGVAPRAGIAGIRLTSPTFQTDAMEASSQTHQNNNQGGLGTIHIYNNSWGPQDDGRTLAGPGPLMKAALESGTATGRGGLGSIFVWAVGNGRGALDNANYDGYSNSRFVIGTAAITNQGLATSYSEPGTNVFVCAPSDGGPGALSRITTTDRTGVLGYNTNLDGNYATTFAGTSAAAPQVAGVAALMLEANPALTWRDVKHILALTTVKNDAANPGWITNAAGYDHHDSYGFGLADANAAATLATTWQPVSSEVAFFSGTIPVNLPVADGTGMSLTVPVYGAPAVSSFVCTAAMNVETVVVTVNALHNYRGDMQILLTSPTGVQSVLGSIRNDSGNNYTNWSFSTVKNWREYAAGTWTLQLRDGITNDSGTFVDWSLAIYGTAAVPFPQPSEITKPDTTTARLTFPTQPGTDYQVFESTTLAPGSWQPSEAVFTATSVETTRDLAVPPLAERMLFRVAPVD